MLVSATVGHFASALDPNDGDIECKRHGGVGIRGEKKSWRNSYCKVDFGARRTSTSNFKHDNPMKELCWQHMWVIEILKNTCFQRCAS
jgi:hypothetical protein